MNKHIPIKLMAVALAGIALAGCENDAASYQIDGRDNALTLIREQHYFWSDDTDLGLVVARLPDCQRRHPMKPAPLSQTQVSVYEAGPQMFNIQQGKNWYAAETQGCTFQAMKDAPEPPGKLLGTFSRKDGRLRFVAK